MNKENPTKTRLSLVVNTANKETFVLPYGHFLFARYIPPKESGTAESKIVVAFATHTVFIEGANLEKIIQGLSRFEIPRLSICDGSTDSSFIINSIAVVSMSSLDD